MITQILALLLASSSVAVAAKPLQIVDPKASPTWEATLARVTPAVVSIRVTATRDFDTEDASVSQGTGFVIDAKNGIILTNRHMVHAGPVRAEAVFLNNEEVELQPLYRDPIHDFGFYKFDPSAVKYQDVVELPLAPDAARVGLDIRVVGNDAGEKISILDGTLARLDRNAPDYGEGSYNDVNTFYYQAASNTSGGSSGSPVIDIQGRVVALNAGGNTSAASSFYLPLFRVVAAFHALRDGGPGVLPRGTLEAVLLYTPYDELIRLGLDAGAEKRARKDNPEATGLLVVDEITPDGPADGRLRVGDILLRVNGTSIADFVELEGRLDGNVGGKVDVEVERGGKVVAASLPVADLNAITPHSYLEVSRAILNDLSYQMARAFHRPVQGVYVALPGYMLSTAGITTGTLITSIDGTPTPDLAAIQQVLESKADGQRLRVRYEGVTDTEQSYETVVVMDRSWFAMRRCTLDNQTGEWPCVDSPPAPPPKSVPPPGELLLPVTDRPGDILAPSLVYVDFDVPYPTAGVKDLNYVGVGTVIDAKQGLVLVDRDTVPVALGDMMLTFAGAVRVPGRLVYLHPVHDFAIVQYDPKLLGDVPVSAVTWAEGEPREGDRIWQVGLNTERELVVNETSVSDVDVLRIGASSTPRPRDINVTGIDLAEARDSLGGVLCDKKGRVYALWASFLDPGEGDRTFHGLPGAFLRPVIDPILRGETPKLRALGVELQTRSLADARDRGLSDARVRQIAQHDPARPRLLEVVRVWGGTTGLRDTDLILELDGHPVTRMEEIEALDDREVVHVTVLRDGEEVTLDLPTVPLDGDGVDRVVSWAGLLAHEPHLEVAAQEGYVPEGVYIGWLWFGSPASRYGLRPTNRIVAVNDKPTPDLDAFLSVVSQLTVDRAPVVLQVVDLTGRRHVTTLKLDLAYWGTELLERVDGKWVRKPVGGATP
jgi:S1-C subfamily serine protease